MATDGTCKTCRWWDGNECDFVNTLYAETPATRFEVEAWASDDTGLGYRLITGPDFGCVHHSTPDAR